MAQIRMRDYKEPLASFNHNIMQFTRKPGRFVGFDTMEQTSTLGFNIRHDATGTTYKNEVQTTIGPAGVLMTTQGVFVIEDTPLTGFTVDTNSGNTFDRIDLLVCNHQFLNLAGGQAATYSIIKGPIGNATPPALTNPFFQVIVGRILLPAGATDLNQCTYFKERCPDSGDGKDARLTDTNEFATLNQFNFAPINYGNLVYQENLGGQFGWTFDPVGNSFTLDYGFPTFVDAFRFKGLQDVLNGTIITVSSTQFVTFRNNIVLPSSALNRGYRNLLIPNSFANILTTVSGQPNLAIKPNDGTIKWILTFIKSDNQWILCNVQGNSSVHFKPGMVIEADLTSQQVADNFEADGLGKNLYLGWQMCNGLRNTRDRRCRFSVMSDQGPNAGASALASSLLTYAIDEFGSNNARKHILQGHLPSTLYMQLVGKGIKKSGTNNGVIVLGAATVDGASPDPTHGDFTVSSQITNPGGDQSIDMRPPYQATFFLMKL